MGSLVGIIVAWSGCGDKNGIRPILSKLPAVMTIIVVGIIVVFSMGRSVGGWSSRLVEGAVVYWLLLGWLVCGKSRYRCGAGGSIVLLVR